MKGVLVLGGARSGKSAFGERLVKESGLMPYYLATARAEDDEMRERIDHHQQQRGAGWQTIEEPLALVDALSSDAVEGRAILVDCLTLWLSNLMVAGADIAIESRALAQCAKNLPVPVVFISNEVGQGIVPDNKMAREFRDHAGRLHQMMAAACGEVWFITAGIPQKLK